jgi:hypothetical protein
MVSSSVADGYETCSDLEKDITEALKLYMSNFISSEAETTYVCDPNNENWMMEYYGYDYYYHDYSEQTLDVHLLVLPLILILLFVDLCRQ